MKRFAWKRALVFLLVLAVSVTLTVPAFAAVEMHETRVWLSCKEAEMEQRELSILEGEKTVRRTLTVMTVPPGASVELTGYPDGQTWPLSDAKTEPDVPALLYTKSDRGYTAEGREPVRLGSGNVDDWFAGVPDGSLYQITYRAYENPVSPYEGKLFILYANGKEGSLTVEESEEPPAEEPKEDTPPAFTDVPSSAYYADAVSWAVKQGITLGTTPTTFAPEATTTRGNVMTFLWRWAGQTEPGGNVREFSDVDSGRYCFSSVLWAVERNVTKGKTETTFAPDELCSYGHVLTFLWRFMGSPDPAGTGTLAGKYEGQYYRNAIEWAEEQGLLANCLTGFSPANPCPRADVVQFLYLMGRLSVEECLEKLELSGLYGSDGKAKVTVDMVETADLWTRGAYNDRPGEHDRYLNLTEEQKNDLVWVVAAKTPYSVGGLPHGGPLRNASVFVIFRARTGETVEYGFNGQPDNG